jgi:hypothetical protein
LWGYIARGRAGHVEQRGFTGLAAAAAHIDRTEWPGPVIDAALQKISLDDLLRTAARLPNRTDGFSCQTPFFFAELGLADGRATEAKLLLSDAALACEPGSPEHIVAVTELERLGP